MSIAIDQALTQDFIDAAYGLPIVHENLDYKPVAQTAYAELIMIPNAKVPQSVSDLDENTGIFRIILRYPLNTGAFAVKTQAEAILTTFKVGSVHTYSSLDTRVTRVSRQPGVPEDGWYKMVLTISYITFTAR